MSKRDCYLIFRIRNGRLEAFSAHETHEAAKASIESAGLTSDWKIAPLNYWPNENADQHGKRSRRVRSAP